ncbi:hypothetical protein L6R29_02030 [Myxococcota bacterium]|nr:hypothetical protein [Myxococcota bacterium]
MTVQIKKEELFSVLPEHAFAFFADTPVVYHCHHYNLWLDQTIDDALGTREGMALRTRTAHEAFYHYLAQLVPRSGADTPAEKLKVAELIFAAMGHGNLRLHTQAQGGLATGDFLHYGYTWKEKYGEKVRRRHTADAVAAGCAVAATEIAFDLPMGTLDVAEETCVSLGAPQCRFQIEGAKQPMPPSRPVGKRETQRLLGDSFSGKHEEQIRAITTGLRSFLGTINSDERGLVQGFGVFVTLHLASYYNGISYNALYNIERTAPQSFDVMQGLLVEAGHQCGFNTFGGILRSPEWEGLVGAPTGDPLEILIGCCAIGRALGFGQWTIQDFAPDKHFVLRTPGTYESTYHVTRHGLASSGRCYLHQGGTLAAVQLAHRVPWREKPTFDQAFYRSLFHSDPQWRFQETHCVSKGDDYCEVAVERIRK